MLTLALATIVLGWRLPGPADVGLLVLTGILGGVGQILLTESYRYADGTITITEETADGDPDSSGREVLVGPISDG